MHVSLDGKKVTLKIKPGTESDFTRYNRFGLITTWIDGNVQSLFVDDLQDFSCNLMT